MTSAKDGINNELASFDYDFERKRLSKTGVSGLESYVYAGNQIVNEYNAFGTPTAKYTIGAGEVIKSEFGNTENNYHFTDALGSVTSLAKLSDGSLTTRNEYNAFGEVATNGASANSIGYTGQRLDAETGLMALGNGERYYSPAYARFIQQDSFEGLPENTQSLNRFSYVVNNPTKHTDPSGHIAPLVVLGLIFLGGVLLGAGFSVARQSIQIAEGAKYDGEVKKEIDWEEVGWSALIGGAAAVALTLAPELVIPMSIMGIISGANEISQGNYATGLFDIATSLLPFKNAKTKGKIFAGTRTGKKLGWSDAEVLSIKQRYEKLRDIELYRGTKADDLRKLNNKPETIADADDAQIYQEANQQRNLVEAQEQIAKYRENEGLPQFNPDDATTGTVAFTKVGKNSYFGRNPKLIPKNQETKTLRRNVLKEIQTKLGKFVGLTLNYFNSLSHAEAQSLMKSKEGSGFLPNKITTYVDKVPCDWCENDKALSALVELYKIQEWTIISKEGEGLVVKPNEKPKRFILGGEENK